MKKIVLYLKEAWHRLFLKSPSFFQVIQWIGAITTFVSGLPSLLLKYQSELGIVFPNWVSTLSDHAATIAGVVAYVIAKFAVSNPDKTKLTSSGEVKPLLPFTKSK